MKHMKMIGAFALTAILLSGCGAKQAVQVDGNQVNASPSASDAAGAAQQGGPRNSMNPSMLLMIQTFQALTMMDKADGLAITKEQADPMLPIVQAIVDKNEMTTDEQTKLLASLTPEQKKFYDDNAAAMKERLSQRGQGGKGGQGGQGGKRTQGDQTNQSDPNAPSNSDDQAAQKTPRPRPSGGVGGGGGFQNMGKQFLELLQSKSSAVN
jgi:polyhydroxyalkanoate synthesis regulator phasin